MSAAANTEIKSLESQPSLSVLLIDADSSRSSLLQRALLECNYKIIAIAEDANNLSQNIDRFLPDVIIVGIDFPDQKTLQEIALRLRHCSRTWAFYRST